MKLFQDSLVQWEAADDRHFSGSVRVKRSGSYDGQEQIRLYLVEFQAEARTYWHRHDGPQLLIILSGVCLAQNDGEAVATVAAGDSLLIEPGHKHWHGASPAGAMTHLAVNVNASTTWLEEVTLRPGDLPFDPEN